MSLSLKVAFSSITARCLTHLFSNFAPPNLQYLSFELALGFIDEDEVWTCLMEVGHALECHPLGQLRRVRVEFNLYDIDVERYCQKLEETFPLLSARGIVTPAFIDNHLIPGCEMGSRMTAGGGG
jgi:hypothetical protein